MASRDVDKLPSETGDLGTISGSRSRCGSPDITEEHRPDKTTSVVKTPKSGKFRTALTFFGVRKSMCLLPSFFGGRSKNQSKWSSKKGIYKSKTHDGLSQISHDDSLRGGSTSTGDFEYTNQSDCTENLHDIECSLPNEQKSQSLTRQKRGLKSFFNGFKHHKNHRNDASDKTEMIAMSSPHCHKEVPPVQDNPDQYVTECLESEPDVPDSPNRVCDSSPAPECNDAEVVTLDKSLEKQSPRTEVDDELRVDQTDGIHLMAVVSSEHRESGRGHSEPCLLLEMIPDPALKSGTPAGSSDQLNLIYAEVASLKSFDSLTGCGDIIADQEDDSISETTVSGERSRNGGKRASCFLTYQGGGEEMASPEDLDEQYLHDFWENNASEELHCPCNQDRVNPTASMMTSHNMDFVDGNSAPQASTVNTSADVLTPQSEHQESVPNSDEGYYDSITPGPDEGQDKTDRLRQTNRLPRDSYSGDALYELFATDESLVSPHNESKLRLSSSKRSEQMDVTDSAFSEVNRLQSADHYKVRDLIEAQSTCKSFKLTRNTVALQEIDWNDCNLNSKPQTSLSKNFEADEFDVKGNALASSITINDDCDKRHGNLSSVSTLCDPEEQTPEENKAGTLPLRNVNSQSPDCNSCLDEGQTVCFSQALVNYEKSSQMMSNLHNVSVDVLETNAAFTPNMEALPTIVTFDVVDMHNEGEYDEQIHMELEEDISSPFQEFEDSYLQKDAFAECDYQMLDLYEQSLISNTWAIASLPRHLGLTRLSQSVSNPLSLDRRSRSLDTESLQSKMPVAYSESRAATPSGLRAEGDPEREPLAYYKKNVLMSASEVSDGGSAMALPWQSRSEMALSLPLSDEDLTDTVQKHQTLSDSFSWRLADSEAHLCSDAPMSGDVTSQDAQRYNRPCHLPLQSDSCLPPSAFAYSGIDASYNADADAFSKAAADLQSYIQFSQSRQTVSRERISHSGSPLRAGVHTDDLQPATNSPKRP
ncbi:APC membrane recruitment protein 1-like [Phycodurus eques]|uniref:APC membrane recruitment protein 1-like n=1 Tax=Phycodurus eques TaxID=693459 RepID=UPI002ACD678F|nr:APC membrane recruitment protein 1-like [Phycodurus eques]